MNRKQLISVICFSAAAFVLCAGLIVFAFTRGVGLFSAILDEKGEPTDTGEVTEVPEDNPPSPSLNDIEDDKTPVPAVREHVHSFELSYSEPATCLERGYSVYTCVCGLTEKKYTEEPAGHSFTAEKTVNPSCENMGYTYYSCSCGYGYKGDFTTGGDHVFRIKKEVPVTCTEKGYIDYICVCGYEFTGDIEEPKGHDFQAKKTVAPTCESKGYTLYECVCGLQEKRDYVDALSHDYKAAKVVAATCTSQGYTTYKCANCGKTYNGNYKPVGAHPYEIKKVIPATATQSGYTVHICHCGATYTDSTVKATGSKPTAPYSTVKTIKIANAENGFVFDTYGKTVNAKGDMEADLYPASITKLVTALVAYQYADDSLMITAGDELNHVSATASRAGFYKGYRANLGQLMAGLLLPSGCDAGYIIAQGVGRVIEPKATSDEAAWLVFVCEMNIWSRKNGLVNSEWKNPDGNHAAGHHTCMRDLIVVAQKCYANSKVMKYTKLRSYSCTIASGKKFTWNNTNGMLSNAGDCIGLKTGYTVPAGNCLLTLYEYDKKLMVIGVFNCPSSAYRTSVSKTLYDIFHDQMTAKK